MPTNTNNDLNLENEDFGQRQEDLDELWESDLARDDEDNRDEDEDWQGETHWWAYYGVRESDFVRY